MSRDKQIDEIACDMGCLLGCNESIECARIFAEALYNAGYRKASSVAEQIFAEIEEQKREVKNMKIQSQIEEAYKHIKPYLKDQKELPEMCKHCERYCGKKHDYEECRDMMCFKFYLAYVYLDWCNNSDGY